jgi:hypothetical protein
MSFMGVGGIFRGDIVSRARVDGILGGNERQGSLYAGMTLQVLTVPGF